MRALPAVGCAPTPTPDADADADGEPVTKAGLAADGLNAPREVSGERNGSADTGDGVPDNAAAAAAEEAEDACVGEGAGDANGEFREVSIDVCKE
jgi:hypothetical protein